MKIKISNYIYKKCIEFAEKRAAGSSELYRRRGELCNNKIYLDALTGAVGEWGAYQFLKQAGLNPKKPDMKIYDKANKSFDADLNADGAKFHVKSQNLASRNRYGDSWLLQRHDKVVKAPEDNEYFILTSVDGNEVEILACVKIADICEADLWGECRVPRYRHSKVALYLDHLEGLNLRRFYESKNV